MELLPPKRWPLLPPVRTRFLAPIRVLLLIPFIQLLVEALLPLRSIQSRHSWLPMRNPPSSMVSCLASHSDPPFFIFLTRLSGSDNVTTSPGDFAEDSVDTAGFVRLICCNCWSFLPVCPGS